MKTITIKKGEKDLLIINIENNLSDKDVDDIEKFNNEEILSYTTIFNEGVNFSDVSDISNIKPKQIKEVIVILK